MYCFGYGEPSDGWCSGREKEPDFIGTRLTPAPHRSADGPPAALWQFLPVLRPRHHPRRYSHQSRPVPQPAIAEERSQRVQGVVEPCQLPLRCACHAVCVQFLVGNPRARRLPGCKSVLLGKLFVQAEFIAGAEAQGPSVASPVPCGGYRGLCGRCGWESGTRSEDEFDSPTRVEHQRRLITVTRCPDRHWVSTEFCYSDFREDLADRTGSGTFDFPFACNMT